MGIRDWFGRREPAPATDAGPAPLAGRRFTLDRGGMFDLERTGALSGHFSVPPGQRDGEWQEVFFGLAWTASVALADPQVFLGPDGFPYLRLDVPRPGPFDSQCLANLAGNCLDHGVGAAFFASPDEPVERPQYVLSFGLIDSLVRYDSPWGDPIDRAEAAEPEPEGAFDVEPGQWSRTMTVRQAHEVLVGTPSADYLPPHAARALAGYLAGGWGLADPRVQLVADMQMRPHRSLVVGRKRSEFAPDAPIDDLARAVLWYLTPQRSVMLMPEEWTLDQMTPLAKLAGQG